MSDTKLFESLFLIFFFTGLALKYYLDMRQLKSVRTHRGAVPASFTERVTLQAHQKAADYTTECIRYGFLARLVSAAVVLLLTYGGILEDLYLFFTGLLGNSLWAQVLIVLGAGLISEVVDIPFSAYETFRIEARYGFNTTTVSRFIKDLGLSFVLSLVLGVPLLLVIFSLWDTAGSLWWLWAWGVYLIFNLAVLWIFPTFLAPLFNKFTPLPAGELSDRLHALLDRVGFSSKGLFVMDASKRSAKGNAYMTGFGKNKRIVLFDTLIEKLSAAETEAVLAHELGHSKLNHVIKMMAVSFLISLPVFWGLSVISECSWFYEGLGVTMSEGPSHAVALILFTIALQVFLFPISPLTHRSSRRHEYEADAFAVKHSDGRALISALVKLFSDNASTLTPDALYSAFYASHPDASLRIAALEKEIRKKEGAL